MAKAKTNSIIKRIVDAVMSVLLLFLMAYQITGEVLHEWIGIGMTALVILHQILNRKWYSVFFKGKYNPYRLTTTILNILLLLGFALTAFCGMSMSGHAVPFLYGMAPMQFTRRMHLSMSYWTFVLMGLHLGMHVTTMFAGLRLKKTAKTVLTAFFIGIGGIGLGLFLKSGIPDYLFFRTPFAFLDYDKSGWLVFLENLLMLSFWALIGAQAARICRNASQKAGTKENPLIPVVVMMAAVIIGIVFLLVTRSSGNAEPFGETNPPVKQTQAARPGETAKASDPSRAESVPEKEDTMSREDHGSDNNIVEVQDGFRLIRGGAFLMGSPETENWRIDDETQHEVTVGAFYMDPYETTQREYIRLMGENPSTFTGEDLPLENITWTDAIRYANAKSVDAGLTPVYSISEGGVSWNLAANGYRLPTEAEWEYACRAGTQTPFNTERSLSAAEANFYGHYPYEIEENYFDNSVLEARPGEYRAKTVAVGSFTPNAWGLYDMHGNVNEWCWDYYGDYDTAAGDNPTGPASGTRHVYRGGGWNDFAKNMRSAYRAAGQEDMHSYNLGLRLVRNADNSRSGFVTAGEAALQAETGGKILIAYFSWSGNTRGIAGEIRKQTGADLFEIRPVHPYSSDYNSVLMEAQEDQHKQARPELAEHLPNIDDYDIIILGYPNWWASIPMPIATFLEEYDLSGKTILPFCSHGGGRFGQSLTAIAKLAPNAVMGTGLSVHYSGGSKLPEDVAAWLSENGIGR